MDILKKDSKSVWRDIIKRHKIYQTLWGVFIEKAYPGERLFQIDVEGKRIVFETELVVAPEGGIKGGNFIIGYCENDNSINERYGTEASSICLLNKEWHRKACMFLLLKNKSIKKIHFRFWKDIVEHHKDYKVLLGLSDSDLCKHYNKRNDLSQTIEIEGKRIGFEIRCVTVLKLNVCQEYLIIAYCADGNAIDKRYEIGESFISLLTKKWHQKVCNVSLSKTKWDEKEFDASLWEIDGKH